MNGEEEANGQRHQDMIDFAAGSALDCRGSSCGTAGAHERPHVFGACATSQVKGCGMGGCSVCHSHLCHAHLCERAGLARASAAHEMVPGWCASIGTCRTPSAGEYTTT